MTTGMALDFNGTRLDDDDLFDEVRLNGAGGPTVRLVTRYRYKTSGLSGDEWRTSVMWQTTLPMKGAEPAREGDGWFDFDGGYHRIGSGLMAIYPSLYASQEPFHGHPIVSVDFCRKGRPIYRSSYDGKTRPLLVVAGHLSWAHVLARENFVQDKEFDAWNRSRCWQPGCAEEAVSTYRILFEWADRGFGEKKPAERSWGIEGEKRYPARRFCLKHLRRGDCGLSDSDANYEVVEGPGPDGARGWQAHESKARLGGIVTIGKPDGRNE